MYDFFLAILYFTGNDEYQFFWSMLNLLTMDDNKKVISWLSTRLSF